MPELAILRPTDYGGLPAPGKCKLCGSVSKELYLDTGSHEEFYGAVLYCVQCMAHMASLLGFISGDKANELKLQAELGHILNTQLLAVVDKLQGAINALVSAGYNSDSSLKYEPDLDHLNSLVIPESPSGESDLGEGEGTVTQSGDDFVLAGLPTNDSRQQSLRLFDE